jgi:hypothetical protein
LSERVRDSEGQGRINAGLCWWEAYAIFGCNKIDREIIGLKISEQPIEMKLVFVRDDIRFRRFSTTNQIHSWEFDNNRIWREKRRKCAVPEFKKSKLISFRETRKFYLRAQKSVRLYMRCRKSGYESVINKAS